MDVELVNVQTTDAVRLDGYLRTAPATVSPLGLDVVICHHGVGGNFYGPSFFDPMGDRLLQQGCAILRVNSRGHDQAFHVGERRLGAAYELLEDCALDLSAWLDFAEQRGYKRIGLWGHSLGAVKTVYFVGAVRDRRVVCAVASSPPRFVYQTYVSGADGARFAADIRSAQELIAAGKPEALVDVVVPVARPFSARTYIDKYGPDARFDYFAHLPGVGVPLLLTLGSLESDNISFAPLAEQGPSFSSRWPGISYQLIDGADHSYTDRTDQLWNAVAGWLKQEQVAARQGELAAR
jgi:pimeloyl-ACP methyl ester carboxylesterase